MTVKNLRFIAIALAAVAVSACQKEPSTSDLHKDYLVYTAYDTDADFAAVETYFIPDSILVIGNNDKTEYWKDADALGIVDAVVARMDAAGYVRSEDKQAANVGIQMSFVKQVTYFVGYDNPYWWWYYPYYWTPGYWGNWGGWHYPLPSTASSPSPCAPRSRRSFPSSTPRRPPTANCPSSGTASSAGCSPPTRS